MDNFDSASPLLFRQRELFNILVYERRPRQREINNKGKLRREFDTEDLVVVRKQVKSNRKEGISQNFYSKQRDKTES